MKHLSLAARILTPLAMVVFLSYELSQSLAVTGWWYVALLVGSICTAVGIEFVGIMAGHTLEGYAKIGNQPRAVVSFGLLMVYTVTAVYILAGSPLVVVPIIAAIVYVLAALSDGLETAVHEQARETAVNKQAQLDEQRRQADHARQMELKAQEQAHDERLEKLRLKGQNFQPKVTESQPKVTERPKLSGSALKVYMAFRENPELTNAEIGESLGLSGQRVGQIKKELNGLVKA